MNNLLKKRILIGAFLIGIMLVGLWISGSRAKKLGSNLLGTLVEVENSSKKPDIQHSQQTLASLGDKSYCTRVSASPPTSGWSYVECPSGKRPVSCGCSTFDAGKLTTSEPYQKGCHCHTEDNDRDVVAEAYCCEVDSNGTYAYGVWVEHNIDTAGMFHTCKASDCTFYTHAENINWMRVEISDFNGEVKDSGKIYNDQWTWDGASDGGYFYTAKLDIEGIGTLDYDFAREFGVD